jgi:hypothetical protein
LKGQKYVLEKNLDFTAELIGKLEDHREEDKNIELQRRKLRR